MTTSQRQVVSAPRHSAGPRKPRLPALPLPMVAVTALITVLLAAVLVVAAFLPRGDDRAPSATSDGSSPVPTETDGPSGPGIAGLKLDPLPSEVPRMRPVPLSGTARAVPAGTRLVVQDLTGAGTWTSFPLRPVVDEHGRFHTYVELGAAGVHRVRVVEPRAVVSSDVLEVRVR